MKRMIGAVLAGSMLLLSGSAFAAEVDRREGNQQARIEQGERTGALTPGESAHLEQREAQLHREIARDRARHGGHLTPAERRHVERQENRVSNDIARKAHNARRM